MKLSCECGFSGFVEPVNTSCPACHADMALPRMVDFEDFRPILDEALEKIKLSVIKHGDWSNYTDEEVFEKVAGEFDEYREAYVAKELNGRHGQISELLDVIVTAVKGVRRLKCLQS